MRWEPGRWDPNIYWVTPKGVNIRLSENFESHEFDCHCTFDVTECGITVIKKALVFDILEPLRWKLSKYEKREFKLVLECGNRCVRHNRAPHIKGADDSRHLPIHGDASDLKGIVKPAHVRIAEETVGSKGGFGAYSWGVHVDARGKKARW